MKTNLTVSYVRIDPKDLYYRNNGTGRDTYIGDHNGGLFSQNLIDKLKPKLKNSYISMHYPKSGQQIRRVNPPAFENKVTHYHCDGTGRDTYIKVTDGGRSTPFTETNKVDTYFHANLRKYSKIRPQSGQSSTKNLTSPPFFDDRSEKQIQILNNTNMKQKQQSLRLSQPKRVLKPPQWSFTPNLSRKSNSNLFFPKQ